MRHVQSVAVPAPATTTIALIQGDAVVAELHRTVSAMQALRLWARHGGDVDGRVAAIHGYMSEDGFGAVLFTDHNDFVLADAAVSGDEVCGIQVEWTVRTLACRAVVPPSAECLWQPG